MFHLVTKLSPCSAGLLRNGPVRLSHFEQTVEREENQGQDGNDIDDNARLCSPEEDAANQYDGTMTQPRTDAGGRREPAPRGGVQELTGECHLFQEKTGVTLPARHGGRSHGFRVLPLQRSHMLFLVAAPSTFSLPDLLAFFGESRASISILRVFRRPSWPSSRSASPPIHQPPDNSASPAHRPAACVSIGVQTEGPYQPLPSLPEDAITTIDNGDGGDERSPAGGVRQGAESEWDGEVDVPSPTPDFYSALVILDSQQHADNFYQAFHGKSFPSFTAQSVIGRREAPDSQQTTAGLPCCYLVFVASVTYWHAADGHNKHIEPPSPPLSPSLCSEIPSCPVCLERLDVSVTGILTQSSGWLSAGCLPLRSCNACRCVVKFPLSLHGTNKRRKTTASSTQGLAQLIKSSPQQSLPLRPPTTSTASSGALWEIDATTRSRASTGCGGISDMSIDSCRECGAHNQLWICLVCGHFGCGRYAGGHAKEHAATTGHRFCLQLSSGRIWDYDQDVFVHRRLVQAVAAGRFFEVALPHPADPTAAADGEVRGGDEDEKDGDLGDPEEAKKASECATDHLGMELDVVLVSQLDYQRHFFEEKLREAERSHACDLETLKAKAESLQDQAASLRQLISQGDHNRHQQEKALKHAQARVEGLRKDVDFLKEINHTMRANLSQLRPSTADDGPSAAKPDDQQATTTPSTASATTSDTPSVPHTGRSGRAARRDDALDNTIARLKDKLSSLYQELEQLESKDAARSCPSSSSSSSSAAAAAAAREDERR
ncbi:unnamed protein product [Vitrella brassicaformis CCMP3155]|uniref:UBP-type domain-containing protein n=1 Tax=Vitrella brassicaformis (strain CCMP3155) TaxID=1169540 RepID=A0A0G4EJE2_VITBC|nr:unnamed protein product [Vitrella brassicaformis CCMP3155]|eukprot:CEL96633.1 unnamed protein product [Vitrella brassicaformis CCMP3155]